MHPAHAEVAELVLVRDPLDVCAIADASGPQFELEVDDVLERRAFARAATVSGTDQEALPLTAAHPLDGYLQCVRSLGGMGLGAYGETVTAGPQTGSRAEIQLGTGGVDEEVVTDVFALAFMARPRGFRDQIRGWILRAAFRMEFDGSRLFELDPVSLIDGGERKHHVGR